MEPVNLNKLSGYSQRSYPTECPVPEVIPEGLKSDALELRALAGDCLSQTEILLAQLDRQFLSSGSCQAPEKNPQVPTVRYTLADALELLRTTTARLSRLTQVVQS